MGNKNRKVCQGRDRILTAHGQPVGERHTSRTNRGEAQIAQDMQVRSQDYDFSTYHPTMKQKFLMSQVYEVPIVIVDGVAGTGKSTSVIRRGLELLKAGKIQQIVFIKTPSESGDDKIGFLKGGEDEKLDAHFNAMRSIFYDFMTPEKLADEERQGRIKFAVPNFLQGVTYKRSLVIVDEVQNVSPPTVKLITERSGQGSCVALLGDSTQQYAHDHREDGFKDFIRRTTKVVDGVRMPLNDCFVSYHKLLTSDVKRSELAEYISKVYNDWLEELDITDIWTKRIEELGYGG